ncbi:hypothetical protein Pcinc_008614 [Petrolisthes cinctipes]|uniref:Uncharacterized protein n=1 Tax=Petrolisthes cinctipes TaxID=88211 RepID=A0AAE1G8W9_PETCI|nr:hypothetical protein Pcinc_008614 [Petrolisthes cinctipes]
MEGSAAFIQEQGEAASYRQRENQETTQGNKRPTIEHRIPGWRDWVMVLSGGDGVGAIIDHPQQVHHTRPKATHTTLLRSSMLHPPHTTLAGLVELSGLALLYLDSFISSLGKIACEAEKNGGEEGEGKS